MLTHSAGDDALPLEEVEEAKMRVEEDVNARRPDVRQSLKALDVCQQRVVPQHQPGRERARDDAQVGQRIQARERRAVLDLQVPVDGGHTRQEAQRADAAAAWRLACVDV